MLLGNIPIATRYTQDLVQIILGNRIKCCARYVNKVLANTHYCTIVVCSDNVVRAITWPHRRLWLVTFYVLMFWVNTWAILWLSGCSLDR